MRRNFLCGLQGNEPTDLSDLNARLRAWVWEVAHQRVHGTTYELVRERWNRERPSLQPLHGRRPYPYVDDELRKVARDAYVSWQGSRYSVPWRYAGCEVWVREHNEAVEVHYGGDRVATHQAAGGKHKVITQTEHHSGIPLGVKKPESKTLVHLRECAPEVESRPLAVYESVSGGAQ